MGEASSIEWTDHTWNPWMGCTKVSPGCENCYMFAGVTRFGGDPNVVRRTAPATFNKPRRWQRAAKASGKRAMVFTCSWGDFFHRDADEWREDAWAMIRECPDLTFQILTKRHGRIDRCLPEDWGDGYPNVWLGVSIEQQEHARSRLGALASVPAAVAFVSYEPALGPVDWDRLFSEFGDGATLPPIDWLIIGGESGPGARPFNVLWAREAIIACEAHNVAPFVKQLGARPISPEPSTGLAYVWDKKGANMAEWPPELQVRRWPL